MTPLLTPKPFMAEKQSPNNVDRTSKGRRRSVKETARYEQAQAPTTAPAHWVSSFAIHDFCQVRRCDGIFGAFDGQSSADCLLGHSVTLGSGFMKLWIANDDNHCASVRQ